MVVAGGAGKRMGGTVPKQFLALGSAPVLVHSILSLAKWPDLSGVLIVAPSSQLESLRNEVLPKLAGVRVLRVVPGGAQRSDSVRLGLEALAEAAPEDIVLIHDGVRPFPPTERLGELCAAAAPDGAIFAVRCRDTVKRVDGGGRITETLDRETLALAQTPQAFPYGRILSAHRRALAEGVATTDDASVIEAFGGAPRVVEGDSRNIKITTPEDMAVAKSVLGTGRMTGFRVGHGFDAHRLTEGRELILGGVKIDHPTGLLGYSDADVLAHAIADACLGAAKLGDIGRHFPDTDEKWRGADSLKLLKLVRERIEELGGVVVNVDATLIAQRPKVKPYIARMEANLAASLGIPESAVNVKATTTEEMGFTGRQEGMAAEAVVLLSFG